MLGGFVQCSMVLMGMANHSVQGQNSNLFHWRNPELILRKASKC